MRTRMRLTRGELYERLWREPARIVAPTLGISDVALAKICKKHQVPKPGLGYWAKVAHGHRPRRTVLKGDPADVVEVRSRSDLERRAHAMKHPAEWQALISAAGRLVPRPWSRGRRYANLFIRAERPRMRLAKAAFASLIDRLVELGGDPVTLDGGQVAAVAVRLAGEQLHCSIAERYHRRYLADAAERQLNGQAYTTEGTGELQLAITFRDGTRRVRVPSDSVTDTVICEALPRVLEAVVHARLEAELVQQAHAEAARREAARQRTIWLDYRAWLTLVVGATEWDMHQRLQRFVRVVARSRGGSRRRRALRRTWLAWARDYLVSVDPIRIGFSRSWRTDAHERLESLKADDQCFALGRLETPDHYE